MVRGLPRWLCHLHRGELEGSIVAITRTNRTTQVRILLLPPNLEAMPTLAAFDRERITHDIEQLTELIQRKEVMVYWEANPVTRAQLEQEIILHREQLATFQTLIQ